MQLYFTTLYSEQIKIQWIRKLLKLLIVFCWLITYTVYLKRKTAMLWNIRGIDTNKIITIL